MRLVKREGHGSLCLVPTDSRSLSSSEALEEYFRVTVDAQVPDSFNLTSDASSSVSWFWKLLGYSRKERTERYSIPKFSSNPEEVNLATALQYGTATGLVPLQKFQRDFTTKVFRPQYQDFTTLIHAGNTDGYDYRLPSI